MDEIVTFERVLWGFMVFLNGGLLVLLVYRKNHWVVPFFFAYVLFNFLQCFILFGSYRIWGFNSPVSSRMAWGTQIFVSIARALAVAQICDRVLAKYQGIWALARRLLAATAAVVLLYLPATMPLPLPALAPVQRPVVVPQMVAVTAPPAQGSSPGIL